MVSMEELLPPDGADPFEALFFFNSRKSSSSSSFLDFLAFLVLEVDEPDLIAFALSERAFFLAISLVYHCLKDSFLLVCFL